MYNAYEKDIAMLNIYFGGSTVFGKKKQGKAKILLKQHFLTEFERSPKMTWLDFISSLGENDNCYYDFDQQRIR